MTRTPHTYAHLAEKLGICERQFHRWLKAGDPRAMAILRDDITEAWRDDLYAHATDAQIFAEKFKRVDPKLAKQLKAAAKILWARLNVRWVSDGKDPLDFSGLLEPEDGQERSCENLFLTTRQ